MNPSIDIVAVLPEGEEPVPCEPLPADILNAAHFIPTVCRRLLQVGSLPDVMARCGFRKADIRCSIDDVLTATGRPAMGNDIDCVVLGPQKWSRPMLKAVLSKLKQAMGDSGRISMMVTSPSDLPGALPHIDDILAAIGLMRYRWGRLDFGKNLPAALGLVIVPADYNPVRHARELAASGRPDGAIEILDAIPVELTPSNDFLVDLALEKQKHYLAWQRLRNDLGPPHALLSRERREFAQVTALSPRCWESYRIHARFWNQIGRADMGRRVVRSIAALDPRAAMEPLPANPLPGVENRNDFDAPPLWNDDAPAPRILIITHDHSDYGMDTLFHGLCQLLGQHNVVEYPWKPTLHGQNIASANNYPCVFHYPGRPTPVSLLEEELRQEKFDLILYGDVVQMAHGEEVRRLVNANPDIPVVLYDTWDDCHIPMERLLRYIGRKRFDLIFKREMVDGMDYGCDTYPLPFGYARPQTRSFPQSGKPHALFWAGKSEYGLRPIYIPYLEDRLGYALDRRYDQETYQSMLKTSRMGLSFFGCGFDSVRYWELPAHAVMLMAERPPIRIPHNFVDGQTAVFFDDLPELEAKLDYYLNRPDEVARIAAAGHDHYLKHHTCVSRARQMLGRIEWALGGRLSKASGVDGRETPSGPMPADTSDLFLGLVKGENYGWGVCSKYLIDELSKMRSVHVLNDEDGSSSSGKLDGLLFQAITTAAFAPLFEKARGRRNYGYTFFENELDGQSIENAQRYDLILAGSSWCRDRMLEKGITHCDVLIQGIDPKLFYPIESEKADDRFVIFSGGKFELRKGQDILLKAVKILQDKYPDIYLVNCWYNLWPESLQQMAGSPYINFNYQKSAPWPQIMRQTYIENGLDPDRIFTMDLVPHHRLRSLFKQTDIGVFPNRCEGGTNLVLMEYMACAKPVIATAASGHRDIVNEENALLLRRLKNINIVDADGAVIGRWQDPSLDELVARIEQAYHHRDALRIKARRAGNDLQQYTWRHCAQRLVELIDPYH